MLFYFKPPQQQQQQKKADNWTNIKKQSFSLRLYYFNIWDHESHKWIIKMDCFYFCEINADKKFAFCYMSRVLSLKIQNGNKFCDCASFNRDGVE